MPIILRAARGDPHVSLDETQRMDMQQPTDISADDPYRTFGLVTNYLPDGRAIVYSSRSGATVVLSSSQAHLLRFCRVPRLFEEHVAQYVTSTVSRDIAAPPRQSRYLFKRLALSILAKALATDSTSARVRSSIHADVAATLRTFISQGFLVGNAELLDAIPISSQRRKDDHPEELAITVGIPTCDRPVSLQRLLRQLAADQRSAPTTIFISDDSQAKHNMRRNRAIIARADGNRFRMQHLDRRIRMHMARRLATECGVEYAILQFGLLGAKNLGFTYGACRNSLLLAAAGSLSLHLDDDTIPALCDNPHRSQENETLDIASGGDTQDFEFFEDASACQTEDRLTGMSIFEAHGKLLGRTVADCIAGKELRHVRLGELSPKLFQHLVAAESRIAITSMGVRGASGAQHTAHRLFLRGPSHQRLTKSAEAFRRNLLTDYVVRVPRTWGISDATSVMAAGTGFDLRDVLPPFAPNLRNEDGVFAAVLHTCGSTCLQGRIPYSIFHDPEVPQGHASIKVAAPRANDILRRLIFEAQAWPALTAYQSPFQSLGRYLVDLGSLSLPSFRDFVHASVRGLMRDTISGLQQRLDDELNPPTYWVDEVRRYQTALLAAATSPEYFAPSDIAGNRHERLISFQHLILNYGNLLIVWPDVFRTARTIFTQAPSELTDVTN